MSHARLQFRNAVRDVLLAQGSLAAITFVNRVDPLQEGELPVCLVLVTDEQIECETQFAPGAFGRLQSRKMAVQIDLVAKLGATFDDDLEGLAATAEKALALAAINNTFGIPLRDFAITAASKGRPNGEGQSDLMLLRLTGEGWLQTYEKDPETLI